MCLRFLVLAVLVASTVLLALIVHRYLSNTEEEEFESEFQSDATKVFRSIGITLDQTLGAVDAMEVSMVSLAKTTNQSWPFVTIPDFAVRTAKTLRLAKGAYFGIYQIVRREERARWEAYTANHNAWVNESIKLQEADPKYDGPIIYEYNNLDSIWGGWGEPMPEADMYLPTWQGYPVIPRWEPYNWDALTMAEESVRAYYQILKNKKVLLAEAWNIRPEDETNEAFMEDYLGGLDWIKDYVDPGQDPDEPVTDIFYPILDTVEEISIQKPEDEKLLASSRLLSVSHGHYHRPVQTTNRFARNTHDISLPNTQTGEGC